MYIMEKTGWDLLKSKTVWGFGVALVTSYAMINGFVDANWLTTLVQTVSAVLGVVGMRDALN